MLKKIIKAFVLMGLCLLCSSYAYALTPSEEKIMQQGIGYYCSATEYKPIYSKWSDYRTDSNCSQLLQVKAQNDIYKQLLILNNKKK